MVELFKFLQIFGIEENEANMLHKGMAPWSLVSKVVRAQRQVQTGHHP
jgi:hypothetical protein